MHHSRHRGRRPEVLAADTRPIRRRADHVVHIKTVLRLLDERSDGSSSRRIAVEYRYVGQRRTTTCGVHCNPTVRRLLDEVIDFQVARAGKRSAGDSLQCKKGNVVHGHPLAADE